MERLTSIIIVSSLAPREKLKSLKGMTIKNRFGYFLSSYGNSITKYIVKSDGKTFLKNPKDKLLEDLKSRAKEDTDMIVLNPKITDLFIDYLTDVYSNQQWDTESWEYHL